MTSPRHVTSPRHETSPKHVTSSPAMASPFEQSDILEVACEVQRHDVRVAERVPLLGLHLSQPEVAQTHPEAAVTRPEAPQTQPEAAVPHPEAPQTVSSQTQTEPVNHCARPLEVVDRGSETQLQAGENREPLSKAGDLSDSMAERYMDLKTMWKFLMDPTCSPRPLVNDQDIMSDVTGESHDIMKDNLESQMDIDKEGGAFQRVRPGYSLPSTPRLKLVMSPLDEDDIFMDDVSCDMTCDQSCDICDVSSCRYCDVTASPLPMTPHPLRHLHVKTPTVTMTTRVVGRRSMRKMDGGAFGRTSEEQKEMVMQQFLKKSKKSKLAKLKKMLQGRRKQTWPKY